MSRINIPLDALTSRLKYVQSTHCTQLHAHTDPNTTSLGARFDAVRTQSLGTRFANLKPIGEFLNLKNLSKPADFAMVQNRVNYNLSYFSSNYAAVFLMLSIYSLLTNLWLLFLVIFVIGGMWGIGKLEGRDLDVGFARATVSQLYTGLLIIAVVRFSLPPT